MLIGLMESKDSVCSIIIDYWKRSIISMIGLYFLECSSSQSVGLMMNSCIILPKPCMCNSEPERGITPYLHKLNKCYFIQ